MTSNLKPTSVRFTAAEMAALQTAAAAKGTTVGRLLSLAGQAIAAAQGTPTRAPNKITAKLSDAELSALQQYADAAIQRGSTAYKDPAVALRSAARARLHQLGHLSLPDDQTPDYAA